MENTNSPWDLIIYNVTMEPWHQRLIVMETMIFQSYAVGTEKEMEGGKSDKVIKQCDRVNQHEDSTVSQMVKEE